MWLSKAKLWTPPWSFHLSNDFIKHFHHGKYMEKISLFHMAILYSLVGVNHTIECKFHHFKYVNIHNQFQFHSPYFFHGCSFEFYQMLCHLSFWKKMLVRMSCVPQKLWWEELTLSNCNCNFEFLIWRVGLQNTLKL
jgi:hypothetical protein